MWNELLNQILIILGFKYKTDPNNKKYRLALYKEVLSILNKTQVEVGFCKLLDLADENISGNQKHGDHLYIYNCVHLFPEIIKHRPEYYGAYWFDTDEYGMRLRKEILEQAIREISC